jgi:plastocyanin
MNLTIPPIFRMRQTEFERHIPILETADDIGDQGNVTELLRFRGLHQEWVPDMLKEMENNRMKTSPLHVVAAVLGISLLSVLGSSVASATTFTVTVGDGGFIFSPESVTIQPGDTVQWTWSAGGHSSTSGSPGAPSGFWDSGVLNQGATFSHTFNTVGTFPYYCTPHGDCCGMVGTITVSSGTPTPAPTATPSGTTVFGNISTRLRVEMGDNALIGGFIVTGTQPKRVIVRAIGPSLPLAGALANPVLELRDSSGGLIRANDNWRSDQEAEIIATGIPPTNDLESVIVATLPANSSAYTAIVRGVNNGTGIGVVEAYDLDRTVNSKLANISTRGFVQTSDNVLIGGLIVLGQDPLRVIVRAIGPSLPVTGVLGNPTMELRDGSGTLIASNDNWRSDQEAEIIATGIPPANDLESAIVRNLTPGNYTAIVRGVNNTTGIAVVEAYGLN